MRTLRSFIQVVDHHTVVVTALALVATWICIERGLVAELPSALIGIAVVFPIVFSINSAYRRREDALEALATLKGHAVAIAWAHRDWTGGDEALARQGERLVRDLLEALPRFFGAVSADREKALDDVYGIFSALSGSHEELRQRGVPANEVSRVNQYLRAVIIEFEKMRVIRDYRTPRTLRAYSRVFLNAFPILYAPYFAQLAAESVPAVGYGVAVIYSLVLVSLDNIQEALEDPFDTVDEDDIDLDLETSVGRRLAAEADPRPAPGGGVR